MTCDDLQGRFHTEKFSKDGIPMLCTAKKLKWVEFSLPDEYEGTTINMFKNGEDKQEHYLNISCKNLDGDCRDQSFEIDINYNQQV